MTPSVNSSGKGVYNYRRLGVAKNKAPRSRAGLNKQGGASITKVVSEQVKSLPTARTKLSPHCIERCVERGITRKMAEKTIEKGLRYYDPKNQSIVYVLRNGMASGDHLVVAVVPNSGVLKTIFTEAKIPKRWIPID